MTRARQANPIAGIIAELGKAAELEPARKAAGVEVRRGHVSGAKYYILYHVLHWMFVDEETSLWLISVVDFRCRFYVQPLVHINVVVNTLHRDRAAHADRRGVRIVNVRLHC